MVARRYVYECVSGARPLRPGYSVQPHNSCKTLEKLLPLAVPHFPHGYMRKIVELYCRVDQRTP